MILKGPKTEGSHRKQYLTGPLLSEIRERLDEITRCKEFFSEEYQDYGLLLCQPDGRPIDPKNLDKWLRIGKELLELWSRLSFRAYANPRSDAQGTTDPKQLSAHSGKQRSAT